MKPSPTPLHRGLATWSSYLALTFLTLQVSLIGPVMPFLRAEMNLTYAEGALHTSGFAIGMMGAGFLCGPLERQITLKGAMIAGAFGLALGFTLIVMAPLPAVSIIGACIMGLFGSIAVVFVPLILMGLHGEQSDQSITEANFMSYFGALLAPVAVWFCAAQGSWKWVATLVWAVAWVAIALLYLSRLPVDEHKSTHSETKLSPSFWAYWSLLGLSVGVEFCFGVWGASFLEKITGLMRDDAIIGSTAFAACVLTGRLIGVYIIGRTGPWRLALASLLITLAGFFVFWLSSPPAFVLIGLGLSGFGVANLFAAALTLALAAEPGNATKAASRTPLATGLAIILTPLLLGALADSVGLFAGYAIVPLLIGMCLAALFLGRSTLAANAF